MYQKQLMFFTINVFYSHIGIDKNTVCQPPCGLQAITSALSGGLESGWCLSILLNIWRHSNDAFDQKGDPRLVTSAAVSCKVKRHSSCPED